MILAGQCRESGVCVHELLGLVTEPYALGEKVFVCRPLANLGKKGAEHELGAGNEARLRALDLEDGDGVTEILNGPIRAMVLAPAVKEPRELVVRNPDQNVVRSKGWQPHVERLAVLLLGIVPPALVCPEVADLEQGQRLEPGAAGKALVE